MMKIPQTRLAALCSILQALVPECKMMMDSAGWNTQAVDTANVAMVSVTMPKSCFEQYDDKEKIEIGMDVAKWLDMLKVMKDPKSIITIERLENNRLSITDGKYPYTHVPLDVNTIRKRPNPPNLNLPGKIEIPGDIFQEAIKAMGVISDKVWLITDKTGLCLTADGDTDHLEKIIETTGTCEVPEKAVRSLFSLDYMREITRPMKETAAVTVLLSENHPVRLEFELDGIEAWYMIAPRLEADGE